MKQHYISFIFIFCLCATLLVACKSKQHAATSLPMWLQENMNRTTIYDSNGNIYMTLGGLKKKTEQEMQFFRKATDKGVIWKSEVARQEEQENPEP